MTEAPQVKDASTATVDASFAEITQRRRGRIRRYFFERPRAMDAVVVLSYVLLERPALALSRRDRDDRPTPPAGPPPDGEPAAGSAAVSS